MHFNNLTLLFTTCQIGLSCIGNLSFLKQLSKAFGGQKQVIMEPNSPLVEIQVDADLLNSEVECGQKSKVEKNQSLSPSCNITLQCRICHEGGSLVAPCNCTGTLKMVHLECLEMWLSTSDSGRCEICGYNFSTVRLPRSLSEWIKSEGDYSPQGFWSDLLWLLVMTPLLIASVYLCIFGAFIVSTENFWEGSGLILLAIFLLACYFLWFSFTIRFYMKSFQTWRKRNQIVHVLHEQPLCDCNIEEASRV